MNCVLFDWVKLSFVKRKSSLCSVRDGKLACCLSLHSIELLLFSVSVGSRDAICSVYLHLIQHLIDDVGDKDFCVLQWGKKMKKQSFKWFEVWGN